MTHPPRDVRRPSDLTALVMTPSGALQGQGRVKNLSNTGLCVEHPLGLHPGASIGVEIPAGEGRGRITILGEVRWADGDTSGVEVAAMVPHHRARYAHLMDSLERAQSGYGATPVMAPGTAVHSMPNDSAS